MRTSLLFKRFLSVACLLLMAGVYATAQAVIDTTGTGGGTSTQSLFEATGLIYSGMVVLFTALGTKFGWFAKISNKWVYSIAVALVLGIAWIILGFGGFIELLTMYFPIAGTIYQFLKSTGLLKLIGLEAKKGLVGQPQG